MCPHRRVKPWTISPIVVTGQRTLWHPGPAVRECCITRGKGLAIAAWWWEVEQRFNELRTEGLSDETVTRYIVWQLGDIEELLEERVPKPTQSERQRYIWYREDLGLERVKKVPPAFKHLGLAWPCTKKQLDARWKEIARTTHPDKGGNPEQFSSFAQAYQKARALLHDPH